MMKRKASTYEGKSPANNAKTGGAAKKAEHATVAAGLPRTARASAVSNCGRLPDASQFPSVSLSGRLPSPANCTGPIALACLLGTRGANWPRESRLTPFRPGGPRETGFVSALAWALSSPALGPARMVHGIAKGVKDAASQAQRSLAEELVALRMRLETGEITKVEFKREKARIETGGKEPVAKTAKPPRRKRGKVA